MTLSLLKERALPALVLLALTGIRQDGVTVVEREPNNTVATATPLGLGEQGRGVIDPARDVDFWSIDLTAGQVVSLDVDAFEPAHLLDATLELIGPDGRTSLDFNDDFDGLDPRISVRIAQSGRYFAAVRAFGGGGSPAQSYTLNVNKLSCGETGTEQEPDDTPAGATPMEVGQDASGAICAENGTPAGDVDYWSFTGRAGTTLELDVDAASLGFLVDPVVTLYGPDGVTRLAFNDDANGADSRLQFSVTTTGTYFATVAAEPAAGGNPFRYILHLRPIAGGPGDPTTVRARDVGSPVGIAVAGNGDLLVGDAAGGRIRRVSATGVVSTFATGIQGPQGLAFDAFGNLLAASQDGTVYRISAEGQVTPLLTDTGFPVWVAVAPDGRIWVTDLFDRSLRRYGPGGRFEASFDVSGVGGFGPGPLAIGPSGEPWFSSGNDLWKLENGQARHVLRAGSVIRGFAFDVAGTIYAASPPAGRILRFAADGTALDDPFAVDPDAPQAVAFGRDATGATTARLFATDPQAGEVIELNPAGVGQRGLPLGFRPPALSREAAVAGLLGGPALSPGDLQVLDGLGNHNGRFDVGDLRAFLITQGALPGAAVARGSRP